MTEQLPEHFTERDPRQTAPPPRGRNVSRTGGGQAQGAQLRRKMGEGSREELKQAKTTMDKLVEEMEAASERAKNLPGKVPVGMLHKVEKLEEERRVSAGIPTIKSDKEEQERVEGKDKVPKGMLTQVEELEKERRVSEGMPPIESEEELEVRIPIRQVEEKRKEDKVPIGMQKQVEALEKERRVFVGVPTIKSEEEPEIKIPISYAEKKHKVPKGMLTKVEKLEKERRAFAGVPTIKLEEEPEVRIPVRHKEEKLKERPKYEKQRKERRVPEGRAPWEEEEPDIRRIYVMQMPEVSENEPLKQKRKEKKEKIPEDVHRIKIAIRGPGEGKKVREAPTQPRNLTGFPETTGFKREPFGRSAIPIRMEKAEEIKIPVQAVSRKEMLQTIRRGGKPKMKAMPKEKQQVYKKGKKLKEEKGVKGRKHEYKKPSKEQRKATKVEHEVPTKRKQKGKPKETPDKTKKRSREYNLPQKRVKWEYEETLLPVLHDEIPKEKAPSRKEKGKEKLETTRSTARKERELERKLERLFYPPTRKRDTMMSSVKDYFPRITRWLGYSDETPTDSDTAKVHRIPVSGQKRRRRKFVTRREKHKGKKGTRIPVKQVHEKTLLEGAKEKLGEVVEGVKLFYEEAKEEGEELLHDAQEVLGENLPDLTKEGGKWEQRDVMSHLHRELPKESLSKKRRTTHMSTIPVGEGLVRIPVMRENFQFLPFTTMNEEGLPISFVIVRDLSGEA
jgi:hypothetical protein